MSKYGNKRKKAFIRDIPTLALEESSTAVRSKFCLSFLDINQTAGGSFEAWNQDGGMLSSLNVLNKLKDFSYESLAYWEDQGTLVIYKTFPKNSDFSHPTYVPHDVEWGRFRLGNKVRLAGFVIPDELDGLEKIVGKKVFRLDRNTFYIVFLDKDHLFYKTEKP